MNDTIKIQIKPIFDYQQLIEGYDLFINQEN